MKERQKLFLANIVFTSVTIFAWIVLFALARPFIGDFWSRSFIAIGLIFVPVLMSYFIFWKKLDEYEEFYEANYIKTNLTKKLKSRVNFEESHIPKEKIVSEEVEKKVFTPISHCSTKNLETTSSEFSSPNSKKSIVKKKKSVKKTIKKKINKKSEGNFN